MTRRRQRPKQRREALPGGAWEDPIGTDLEMPRSPLHADRCGVTVGAAEGSPRLWPGFPAMTTSESGLRSEKQGLLPSSLPSTSSAPSLPASSSPPALIILALAGGAIYGWNVSSAAILPALNATFALTSLDEEIISAAATLTDALTMLLIGWFLLNRIGRRRV